jgi:hypothetical protein
VLRLVRAFERTRALLCLLQVVGEAVGAVRVAYVHDVSSRLSIKHGGACSNRGKRVRIAVTCMAWHWPGMADMALARHGTAWHVVALFSFFGTALKIGSTQNGTRPMGLSIPPGPAAMFYMVC